MANNTDPRTPARGNAEDTNSNISATTLSTIRRDKLEDDDDGSLQLSISPEASSVTPHDHDTAAQSNTTSRRQVQILEGSFSAVSKPIFATK